MRLHPDRPTGNADEFRVMNQEYQDWQALYRNGAFQRPQPKPEPRRVATPTPQPVAVVIHATTAPNTFQDDFLNECRSGLIRGVRAVFDDLFGVEEPPKKRKRKGRTK